MNVVLTALGALLLYAGGELLVRNAVHLAHRLGVSTMAIGLSIVALGTSAPELAATLVSALRGAPGIAVGNVLGSNIANLGLVLGLAAVLYPLRADRRLLRREIPIMIGTGLVLAGVLWAGRPATGTWQGGVSRVEGLILLLLLLAYLGRLFRADRNATGAAERPVGNDDRPPWRFLIGVVVGTGLLVAGARSLIVGAVSIAESIGVPERVIGLTLVAFGTSIPELASALVAAARRQADLLLGNLVGSNIFNALAVLGVTALVRPVRVPLGGVVTDLGVLLLFSVALLPLMWRGSALTRAEALLLLIGYLTYVVFLFA